VKELNQVFQDLNKEVKKKHKENMKGGNPGKGKPKKGVRSYRYSNRIQMIEERISDIEDTLEDIDKKAKKMLNIKKPNPKHPGSPGHHERTKPKNNKIEESKDSQL
jgi:t-SNARE complex subunit (syntaxin)